MSISHKPNVLLIMCDQMNPLLTPMHGDKAAVMPHLNRLRDSGVLFRHAYCNSPLCTPSRCSMMAGRLVAEMECAWDNASVFNSEIPTFAHMLNREGYLTALSGKMHFIGADQLHGYRQRLTTDIYPADFSWTPPGWDRSEPTHAGYGPRIVRDTGVSNWNRQIQYDEETHARAVAKLRELGAARAPFMLTVSYTHPIRRFSARKNTTICMPMKISICRNWIRRPSAPWTNTMNISAGISDSASKFRPSECA